jgi:hypothetical protein
MLPGPDYYYRCPSCSAVAYQESIASGNTFGAVYWSDAKREAPMLPESSALIACPICSTYLWIESLVPIGQFNRYPSLQQITSKQERPKLPVEWADARQFRTPDAKDLAHALDAGLADTPERERHLRVRLWWRLNDRHRGDEKRDESADDTTFLSNLDKLASLLDDGANDALLRAEIARERGCFSRAVELCDALISMNAAAHIKETAGLIRARAVAEDARVFRLDLKGS